VWEALGRQVMTGETMTIFGWDASDYDWDRGPMDLGAAARDGIAFFTHKATEGTKVTHKHYGEVMGRARAAGIRFLGPYHVVRSVDVGAQVDHLLSYIDARTPWWRDFPGWFFQADLEIWDYDRVGAETGGRFCDLLARRTGKVVLLYASRGQYGNKLTGIRHPFWNANYGTNPRAHYREAYPGDSGRGWLPYSGKVPVIWQYGSRTIIGTQPTCDANAFRGTAGDFAGLVRAASAVDDAGVRVAANADGRLEVFRLDRSGGLHHRWQTEPSGTWSGWAPLGGQDLRRTAVGRNADGRLEAFATGGDGVLYHLWQTEPGGGWSGWASLGGAELGVPVVGVNADGRLEVFTVGGDGVLYHLWQTDSSGGWSGWASLDGAELGVPVVGVNADGRLEVFTVGGDGALYHLWQTEPGGGWSGWASLGGVELRALATGRNADGRLEVFVTGGDGALYHRWQLEPNGGWNGWAGLGGGELTRPPVVAANADGRLEVFVVGGNEAVYHRWQTAANNGWSEWAGLDGPSS
jgi:GH25 family lysozyme M1 (1,4-beta-N-acetylmuramidase)